MKKKDRKELSNNIMELDMMLNVLFEIPEVSKVATAHLTFARNQLYKDLLDHSPELKELDQALKNAVK